MPAYLFTPVEGFGISVGFLEASGLVVPELPQEVVVFDFSPCFSGMGIFFSGLGGRGMLELLMIGANGRD